MLQFDAYGTLVAASLVLLLGRQCVKKIPLLLLRYDISYISYC